MESIPKSAHEDNASLAMTEIKQSSQVNSVSELSSLGGLKKAEIILARIHELRSKHNTCCLSDSWLRHEYFSLRDLIDKFKLHLKYGEKYRPRTLPYPNFSQQLYTWCVEIWAEDASTLLLTQPIDKLIVEMMKS